MFSIVLSCLLVLGADAAQFHVKNNRDDEIWIGTQGGAGNSPLASGGFALRGNEEKIIDAPDNWEGRFWARTGCNGANQHCDTGDCGNKLQCNGAGGVPSVTLVEIKLKGDAGQDFYDISLVDGFNVKASISPINGEGDCKTLQCSTDINPECPNELKNVINGNTVGCKSSCLQYNTDEYCCRGQFNAQTCNPNTWRVNSAGYFKQNCPDAYSYAYDDRSSLKTCKASSYRITFG